MVLFDQDETRLLGKFENDMVKGLPIYGYEDAFPNELNVIMDQRYVVCIEVIDYN